MADTPCPSVTSNISTLNPQIVGAPVAIKLATYDLNSMGLTIQFADSETPNRAIYFVGVPNRLIVGRTTIPWASFSSYPEALVQDQSYCPVLSSNGTPITTTGLSTVTITPFVQALCSLISDGKKLLLVSLVNAPTNVYEAVYDKETQFLNVAFTNGSTALFVSVPQSAVTGKVQWNSLSVYQQAVMAQCGACPLLSAGSPQIVGGWQFGIPVVGSFGEGMF